MTYTNLVRGSSPIGYWKLNGSASAVVGTAATISNASGYWTAPPLVSNSESSLKITPSGASVSIYDSSFNNFYSNYVNKPFTVEFWFSFNGLFDGSGYLTNFNSTTRYFTENVLKIFRIMSGSTEIGSVKYDYNTNTFRFSINGVGNRDAYIPVRNMNTSFYIVANYSSERLLLTVNGEDGVIGYVEDSSYFPSKLSGSVTYRIDGSSLNPSASMNYVIGDVAIYNYQLDKSHQRLRVLLGLSADKPTELTNHLQTSYFDFSEKDYHIAHKEIITGNQFNENVFYSHNFVVSDYEGIQSNKIYDLHASDEFPTSSTTISSSGALFSSSNSALVFDQYGSIFDKEVFKTIYCTFTPTSSPSGYLFSIPNSIGNSATLYASVSSTGVTLGSYDSAASANTAILTISSSISASSQYYFGISIDQNDNFTAFVNDSGVSSVIENFEINSTHKIVIGNLLDSPASNNMYIKNFGMTNDNENSFIDFDFDDLEMYMARLTNDYSVSQMTVLIKSIPFSNYDDDIVGSKITWDGMDNCMVQVSDDGYNWTIVKRGYPIPNVVYGSPNKNKLLKIMVPHEYTVENINQSFNNLDISLYRTMNFNSNDSNYFMTALGDSASLSIYNIKRFPQSILLRQDKPGVFFDSVNGYVNGYAKITATSSVTNTYGMDFWFKPESFTSASNYLIHVSASTDYYVYISGSTNKIIYSPSTSYLYINGSSVTSNSYTASPGEYYHIFYNLGASVNNSSSIILNGRAGASGTHSNGSYAHLNIWNDPITLSTPSSRYSNFVSNNTSSVQDSSSVVWQSNWNSSSIITVAARRIG
jgi:hypothetical protein